jgi:hypothetical protein
MKKVEFSGSAKEQARVALDEIETAFGVKTGVKAGGNAYGHGNPRNPHSEPIIQPLYGVVIAPE